MTPLPYSEGEEDLVHSSQGLVIPGQLVARLEAASAGSRELDCDLAEALSEVPSGAFRMHGIMTGRYGTGPYSAWTAPAYTTSLDAALALAERVLPEWHGDITCWRQLDGSPMWSVSPFYTDEMNYGVEASAPTPALVLCIAILKSTTPASPSLGRDEGEAVHPDNQPVKQEGEQ